jgi:hypothetical protein
MAEPRPRSQPLGRLVPLLLALASCRVLPPTHKAETCLGVVRASTPEEAERVAALVEEVHPAVEAWLPGHRALQLDVWLQDRPTLSPFGPASIGEADGFWAEGVSRIHLREDADSLRRTLVHELVHAALGPEWSALPGTLEEGLCDLASARLAPESAARMRAGRLSSAAFALGGLLLVLEIEVPREVHAAGVGVEFTARLRLEGELGGSVDPLEALRLHAGLSSSRLSSAEKKACYGLALLCVERIEQRVGVEGLYAMCRTARDQGRKLLSEDEILRAAELDADPLAWSRALALALGPEELAELVRAHPTFLVEALAQLVSPSLAASEADPLDAIRARLRVPEAGGASLDLLSLADVREAVRRRLDDRDGDRTGPRSAAPEE